MMQSEVRPLEGAWTQETGVDSGLLDVREEKTRRFGSQYCQISLKETVIWGLGEVLPMPRGRAQGSVVRTLPVLTEKMKHALKETDAGKKQIRVKSGLLEALF